MTKKLLLRVSLALSCSFIYSSLLGCNGIVPGAAQNQNAWNLLPAQSYSIDQSAKTHSHSNSTTQSSSTTVEKAIPNGEITHSSGSSTTNTSGSSTTITKTIITPS